MNNGLVDDSLNDEVWKGIPGYPGYEVSERGRFRSFWRQVHLAGQRGSKSILTDQPRMLKPSLIKRNGRLFIGLYKDGKRHVYQTGHWLLRAFVGEWPGKGYDCRHLDGNPQNNALSNLAWATRSVNIFDSVLHGTHHLAKLTPEDIPAIRLRLAQGDRQKDIARDFGVSRVAISDIHTGKRWSHVA